jgi:ribosomal protein S1
VVGIRDFGAFVDLGGGVQGLLHVSEMGWSRVSDPSQVVQAGDEITVKVLRVDQEKAKISLSLKELLADPWSKVDTTYKAGQLRRVRVTRVAAFGAFAELEPGIDGLIPLSESGVARDADVKRAFPIGDDVDVVVMEVDAVARRIRLSVKAVQQVREADEVREYAEHVEEPAERLGSLADKLRDALVSRPRHK